MAVDNTPLLTRKRLLAAKVETTTGTPVALLAADGAFHYDNVKIVDETDSDERETPGTFNDFGAIPGPYPARVTFDVHLMGGGGSGLPLWATLLLPACDMSATGSTYSCNNGAATVVTLTIGVYEHGRLTVVSGCQGTFKIPFSAGHFGKASFDFRGIAQADSDAALITPTFPSVKPPRWANASAIAFGAFTPRLSKAEFDLGNVVELREDPNDTSGIRSAIIVNRKSKLTADPESTLVATRDWKTLMRASTEEVVTAVLGANAGNIITISGARGQIAKMTGGDRHGLITSEASWDMNSAFTIAFS